MTANSRRQMNVAGPTAAVLAGLLLASCVAPYAPPRQVAHGQGAQRKLLALLTRPDEEP